MPPFFSVSGVGSIPCPRIVDRTDILIQYSNTDEDDFLSAIADILDLMPASNLIILSAENIHKMVLIQNDVLFDI